MQLCIRIDNGEQSFEQLIELLIIKVKEKFF
jgi:hypothetical protein